MRWRAALLLLAAAAGAGAAPAAAQQDEGDPVRFCPNRPSLGASGCTTLPGQVQIELSSLDWQRDRADGAQTDTVIAGDALARIGVARSAEVQVGWTTLGMVRTRDLASGEVTREHGIGDVTLALRRAISHADGKALSAAIQPYVTLPTGGDAIGAGDWSAGVLVPAAWQLDERWMVDFTGQLAARVDEDRDGRHLDATGIVGVGYALTDAVTVNAELSVERDDDPARAVTRTLAAGSLAWQPVRHVQLDMLAVAGLNHDSPDMRLVLGGAVAF